MAQSGLRSLFAIFLLLAPPAFAAQHHLLIVTGIGGLDEYRERFAAQTGRLYQAALDAALEAENIIVLSAEALDKVPVPHRLSDRAGIEAAVAEIGARARAEDTVFVVLIGHGNPRGEASVFNIPGPDISGNDLDLILSGLAVKSLVVVNTASASGPFVGALSADNRVVITATSSGREYHAASFGEYFVAALAGTVADRDKDERISMLEAFDYARHEVRRAFETDKRLLTEHALLDDNGDGVGSLDAGEFDSDGGLASRIYLQQPKLPAAGAAELAQLLGQKSRLEDSIRELRQRRDDMDRDAYYDQLELLLVDLALLSRRIRSQEGS